MSVKIDTFPILPLRDLVVFPGMIVPLFVGREKSLKALDKGVQAGNKILLLAQRNANRENPTVKDLYDVGVIANILQVLKLQDGTIKILVEGKQRVKALDIVKEKGYFESPIKTLSDRQSSDEEIEVKKDEALRRAIIQLFENYAEINPKISQDLLVSIVNIENLGKFCDSVCSHIYMKISDKQEVLEETNIRAKLEKVLSLIKTEIEILNMDVRVKNHMRDQIDNQQKQYYLNEQLKAIHKELGEDDYRDEMKQLASKVKKLKLSKDTREKVEGELKKLKNMNPMSSESAVIRNYIDWIISLPWSKYSKLNKDLGKAEEILDKEHYGLEKVKERILEHLAVNLRTSELRSPIVCLIGPPGVGKTSLVKSIANATSREFVKASLGGLRDESEIKGHRRTYIGAMPGKIIQGMKKAKTSNPVMLLDEIDKMGHDFRGDPSAAMLEVLDPEQNHIYNDHYLEVDYDLSKVMFVATANGYDGIPRPLMDRMEIIDLSGYTEAEKLAIAEQYLIPKQLKGHGLKKDELKITTDAVIEIIRYYTREAGVRGLDRTLAKLARKVVRKLMVEKVKSVEINAKNISEYLKARRYDFGRVEEKNLVGVTNGLAYSEVGGDLLAIEAVLHFGKGGDIRITGKLGDVMKESAQAALSYIRFKAQEFGIRPDILSFKDLHIHVPEGATPKDGPSAGVAMCTSIVSALSGVAVRSDIAMTGEITLRGRVLPIGGLKEKVLAALRGGIKKVLIPFENEKDLEEIPENVKNSLEIVPVKTVEEVFKHALVKKLAPIEWDEAKFIERMAKDSKVGSNVELVTH